MKAEGALASFLNSALGFSRTLFLQLPRSYICIWRLFSCHTRRILFYTQKLMTAYLSNIHIKDVYDFMLFFNHYIEIFLQEIETFREKHKIIDVP